jgi:pimeloyl-ACP methyl ester carboxylesterase
MADDVLGLMDLLHLKSAHVVGTSMGGMIAQELVITYPKRVRSLTSIMSSTGNPALPPPKTEAMALLTLPPPATRDEFIARFIGNSKMLRVGSFPEDEAKDRERAECTFVRGFNPGAPHDNFRPVSLRETARCGSHPSSADAGYSRRPRRPDTPRTRSRYRRFDCGRKIYDDRGHGSRNSYPNVVDDCKRDLRITRGRNGTKHNLTIPMTWLGRRERYDQSAILISLGKRVDPRTSAPRTQP